MLELRQLAAVAVMSFTVYLPAASVAGTYDSAILNAARFLETAQSPDGSWLSEGSQVRFLETSAAVAALEAVNRRSSIYYSGVTWLANHAASNLDYQSRRAIALHKHHVNTAPDIEAIIDSQKNSVGVTGGYGLGAEYEGAPLDTALALQAFALSDAYPNQVSSAIAFLKYSQRTVAPKGWAVSWATDSSSPSDPMVTAHVLMALQLYVASDSSLAPVIAAGLEALKSQVTASSPLRVRALAALAYLKAGSASDTYASAMVSSLVGTQLADGRWGAGAYDTALVMQVIAVAASRDLAQDREIVNMPDEQLRYAINQQLGRNAMDQLNKGELKQLTTLDASGKGISDLSGLEFATNLATANFSNNQISSTSQVSSLQGFGNFDFSGNPIASGSSVTLAIGGVAQTNKTLPGGAPLKIKLVNIQSGELTYQPSSINVNEPALTMRGFLEWLNIVDAHPNDAANPFGIINESVLDPRFSPDDPDALGNVVNRIRTRYNGTVVDLDLQTGEMLGIGGVGHARMVADYVDNLVSGGYWVPSDIRYAFKTKVAVGNLGGVRSAIGSDPEREVVPLVGLPLWTFSSVAGPATLPFSSLAAASSTSALPSILQSAGFIIISTSSTEIVFSGTYIFNGLSATGLLKDFACFAYGCSNSAYQSLQDPLSSYIGQYRVNVRMSIPLTP